MQGAIDEMNRRRERQGAYNEEHGITPRTIVKEVRELLEAEEEVDEQPKKGRGRRGAKKSGEPGTKAKLEDFGDRRSLTRHVNERARTDNGHPTKPAIRNRADRTTDIDRRKQ